MSVNISSNQVDNLKRVADEALKTSNNSAKVADDSEVYFKKSDTETNTYRSTNLKAATDENTAAQSELSSANKLLQGLTRELTGINSQITDAQRELQEAGDDENAVKTANDKIEKFTQELEAKKAEIQKQEEEVGKADQSAKGADAALQRANATLEGLVRATQQAEAKAGTDRSTATSDKGKADAAQGKYETAVKEAKAEEAKEKAEAARADKTQTGGVQKEVNTEQSGILTKTTTKTTNSKEFIEQENQNIDAAKDIQHEYQGRVSLEEENSVDNSGRPSARTKQTEYLATVEYTPEIKSGVGSAEVFEDGVDSGSNRKSAATSIVRDKSVAVDYYLQKSGIEPTGVDEKGKPKYSAADVYAAELAVSALQPEIVANAKETVEYQGKFKNGNASESEINDAINMLKNGNTFTDGGKLGDIGTESKTRTVGDAGQKLEGLTTPLLSDNERDNLVSKLEKMQSGEFDGTLSQRELNALSFLKGSSDVQGFPTVPSGMHWNLPDECMTTDYKSTGSAETYVTNFISGVQGSSSNIKVLTEPGTDGHKIFAEGLSTQHSDTHHVAYTVGNEQKGNNLSRDVDTSDYSKANVKWNSLLQVANQHGGTVSAQELVDAKLLDEGILSQLENPNQRYEIHNMGGSSATFSMEKMIDGDMKTGRTDLGSAKRSAVKQNGGYTITGANELTRSNNTEFWSYRMNSQGKVELTRDKVSPAVVKNPQTWIADAQKRYENYKAQGLIND